MAHTPVPRDRATHSSEARNVGKDVADGAAPSDWERLYVYAWSRCMPTIISAIIKRICD